VSKRSKNFSRARLPLPHERGRRQDQHGGGEPANRELLVDNARLDGLAEAHLVGQMARPPMWRSTRWATSIWCGSALIAFASSVISRSKPGTRAIRSASRRSSCQSRSVGVLEPFSRTPRGECSSTDRRPRLRGGQGQNGWRLRHRHAAGGEGATIYHYQLSLSVVSCQSQLSAVSLGCAQSCELATVKAGRKIGEG